VASPGQPEAYRKTVLPNGIRVVTESLPWVRSVAVGIWVETGSRIEPVDRGGVSHLIEHLVFKGTDTRSAEDIARAIDSVGGQMDAFTAKEHTCFYVSVLDEHLEMAADLLADVLLRPRFAPGDIEREKAVVFQEIKMVEDTPDDLVHELFTQSLWEGHPLGRPILGTPETVTALDGDALRRFFQDTYCAPNLVIAAVGNLEHERVRTMVAERFGRLPAVAPAPPDVAPAVVPQVLVRAKDLEQSHVCIGSSSYPQHHDDRYASYVLNTVLGGSMSSRLFQNVRERRGLAYAVFSGLAAYRDAGAMTIYAGCANEAVDELIDVVVGEVRGMKTELPDAELRRAKDHLKGSLMLNLESTSSRMSHLARQEIYFDRQFGLDETLEGVERVSTDEVQRVARDLLRDGALAATVLGAVNGLEIPPERLALG
jgi:predicted Zn-dependent peptidase